MGSSASVGIERNRTVNLLQQKEAKDIDPGTRALVRVRTDRGSWVHKLVSGSWAFGLEGSMETRFLKPESRAAGG